MKQDSYLKFSFTQLMNQINKWREDILRELAAKEIAEKLLKN